MTLTSTGIARLPPTRSTWRSCRFARYQNGRVRGRHLRHVRQDGLQRRRRSDDLLEHGGLIDLLAQREVVVLESILQAFDLVEGFLERRLRLPLDRKSVV